jgi:hypothetical protein
MKRIILAFIVSLLGVGIINAQSPDMFNYQAVARDDQGNVLSNQDVGIKISILQGSANGTVVYEEEHSKTTNDQGLVNLMIGNGSVLSGTFSNIDWSSGPYFIEVGLDETGGTSYSTMGTSQLLSVPYAKYAESSANTFSGDYQDLTNKPDLSDTASYDDYWMNQGDTVYTMDNKIGIGTDSLSGNLTIQGDRQGIDFSIRDNYSFLQLNASQGNAGVWLSYNNNVKGNFWYNQGNDNVTISRTEFIDNDFVIDANRNIGINESSPAEQLDVNGAVRVQDTTANPEPRTVYANSTPIAYGDISENGNIYSGSYGIASVNRVATGEYDITLRNGFSEYATVSITTWDSGSPEIATYQGYSNTDQITVHIWDMTSSRTDSRFSIVVYGLPEGAKKKKKKSAPKMKSNSGIGGP